MKKPLEIAQDRPFASRLKLPNWYIRLYNWASESPFRALMMFVVVPFILGALPAPMLLLILTLTGDIEW